MIHNVLCNFENSVYITFVVRKERYKWDHYSISITYSITLTINYTCFVLHVLYEVLYILFGERCPDIHVPK